MCVVYIQLQNIFVRRGDRTQSQICHKYVQTGKEYNNFQTNHAILLQSYFLVDIFERQHTGFDITTFSLKKEELTNKKKQACVTSATN